MASLISVQSGPVFAGQHLLVARTAFRENSALTHHSISFYLSPKPYLAAVHSSYKEELALCVLPPKYLSAYGKADEELLIGGMLFIVVGNHIAISNCYNPKLNLRHEATYSWSYYSEIIAVQLLMDDPGVKLVSTTENPSYARIRQLSRVNLPASRTVIASQWIDGMMEGERRGATAFSHHGPIAESIA